MLRCEWKMLFVLLSGIATVGCAQTPLVQETEIVRADLVACEDPRPQVCTMQYDPVCGLTSDSQHKTYSNACSACSDANVSGYSPGACE